MPGYIKLYRKLLENPIFQNEKMLKVFVWCLLKSSYVEHEQLVGLQKVTLGPGEFVYGRIKASQELGIKQSTLQRYILALKNLKILDIKSNNKFSIISIENWALYQSNDVEVEQQTDNKRTTNGQQTDTNKKGNKGKKGKKDMYISAQHLSMTEEEYNKLIEKYGKEKVDKKIEYSRNYAKLKNFKSLYLTINNWLSDDMPQEKPKFKNKVIT